MTFINSRPIRGGLDRGHTLGLSLCGSGLACDVCCEPIIPQPRPKHLPRGGGFCYPGSNG
jgi:hypothetical protein